MTRARFSQVFFDVDSTLVTIEGIDVIGGDHPGIREMTASAMDGRISIEDVYARRLDLIRPSLAGIALLAERYLDSITPGASDLVEELLSSGSDVHLITAAIQQAVLPLAAALGIRARAVHGVPLQFAPDGSYQDFDRRNFLCRAGGKELVIRDLRSRSKGRAALIGDGMSDAEARSSVDLFIGFGGVSYRPAVKAVSEIYVTSNDLSALRPYLLEVPP